MMSKGYFIASLLGAFAYIFIFNLLQIYFTQYGMIGQITALLVGTLVLYFLLTLFSPSFKSGQTNNKYYWCAVFTGFLLSILYYALNIGNGSLIAMSFLFALFLSFLIPKMEDN